MHKVGFIGLGNMGNKMSLVQALEILENKNF